MNHFIENFFQIKLTDKKLYYIKSMDKKIELYSVNGILIYKAPFKCLPNANDMMNQCQQYIEMKYSVNKIEEEIYLILEDYKLQVVDLEYRNLKYNEQFLIDDLNSRCDPKEVEVACLSVNEINVIGVFDKDKLIGVSSLLYYHDMLDIAILVDPLYRNQKIGKKMIQVQINYAIKMQKKLIYRCDKSNVISYQCALSLLFKPFLKKVIYVIKDV